MSVYSKLMEARIRLQNTKLNKSGHNKFAGYQYFELGDFLPQINQIFHEIGLCGIVSFGETLATLTIVDTDSNGKGHPAIEITSPMKEAMLKGCHPIQNLGAVETYTRRYLWVTALEIVEHDALDSSEPIKTDKVASPKESGKSIPKDVFDSLQPEEQNFLNDIAIEIIAALADSDLKESNRLFYENNLDQDQQSALWSRLDSKQRRIIKEYKASLK